MKSAISLFISEQTSNNYWGDKQQLKWCSDWWYWVVCLFCRSELMFTSIIQGESYIERYRGYSKQQDECNKLHFCVQNGPKNLIVLTLTFNSSDYTAKLLFACGYITKFSISHCSCDCMQHLYLLAFTSEFSWNAFYSEFSCAIQWT